MKRILTLSAGRVYFGMVTICFLLMNGVFGQAPQVPENGIISINYINYYRTVALAEEAIVNGKYDTALKYYQRAFEGYPYNNPIDCYVAAQIASYVRDTEICLKLISNGLCFGLPIQTINSNPHLARISNKIDSHSIDSCRGIYRKRIDTNARATMLSLIKRDQSIVKGLISVGESLYESNGYTLKNIYRPIWDSLVMEVVKLTNKSGFPAQKIIGTQNGDDSLFRVGPNSVFVTYIFIHHGNGWNDICNMLQTELLKGNITPQMYGVIYESSNGNGPLDTSIRYFASRPCRDKRCKYFVSNHLKEINSNRWEIGLGSYSVMEKKFESQAHYYKWRSKNTKNSRPYFDFQCDLNFQGR